MAHLDRAAARSNPNIKIAVIAPEGPARKVAEDYLKHSNPSTWKTAIFETRMEAISWLGL